MIKPAKIHVRFADCDMMGHVNNAVYLSYFEQARMHYFAQMVDENWDWKKNGIILVKNEVTYLKPILLHDEPLVCMQLKVIGRSSFTLVYVVKVKEVTVATGESKLVCFDFSSQQPVAVYPKMVEGLEQLDKITQ